MKRLIIGILVLFCITIPVRAADITAPEVPEMGESFMPDSTESFGQGLWTILIAGIKALKPEIASACRLCFQVAGAGLLLSFFQSLKGMAKQGVGFISVLMLGTVLLEPGNSMIALAAETVQTVSEYGKLLLPVMAATLAAQGGGAASAALYASASVFCAVLGKLISRILIPGVYIFLALALAGSAAETPMLGKLKDMIMGAYTWTLKTLLSFFTGFLAITGVISGTTDAAAARLTKAAISGMVPVVGGILSEATESVLVGAGLVKNAAGVYGLLAISAVCIGPFLQIGAQYMLLKVTAAFCDLFAEKQVCQLLRDYSGGLGLLLGMTGACTLLLFISVICFMKGVA